MDANNFEKWFLDILNKLEPGSVAVMDSAPYHSRQVERLPNMSWRKEDVQAWLTNKEIAYEQSEIIAELLSKINKEKFKIKYIDYIANAKNVTICRLPPYHCELNPIELIWAQVKSYIGRKNKTFKILEVRNLLHEAIKTIDKNKWLRCIDHVIKEEEKMKELEGILDTTTSDPTKFIISVSDSSDTESE
ncbi:uncharacterized protein LOC124531150 [Vanessa cardui]|uniref:uncharacterized protein LOC124531150 n=1 Tax=Vanessa cardui TaxID=171605 RepID=UPI001F129067|nr:uncharacterized protein LOC124531150 [Vanessa cardui]